MGVASLMIGMMAAGIAASSASRGPKKSSAAEKELKARMEEDRKREDARLKMMQGRSSTLINGGAGLMGEPRVSGPGAKRKLGE